MEDLIATQINISHKILGETSEIKDSNNRIQLLYSISSQTTKSAEKKFAKLTYCTHMRTKKYEILHTSRKIIFSFQNLLLGV